MGKTRTRPPRSERNWLTPGEAAHDASVSVDTIRRWLREGLIAGAQTPGGTWRVSTESLRLAIEVIEDRAT
jgi:excisionase family DNA binding protein